MTVQSSRRQDCEKKEKGKSPNVKKADKAEIETKVLLATSIFQQYGALEQAVRHQNAKHNGIRYKCDQCDSTFSLKHALVRHVESKHQDKKRIFPCPQCEFVTTRMDYLRGHMENIHLKLKHKCDICGQMLSSKSALLTHRKTKHEGSQAPPPIIRQGNSIHQGCL